MKRATVSRAAASLGLILGNREEPLWENEGPIAPRLQADSPRSSGRAKNAAGAGGKVDVRVTGISGLERAWGPFAGSKVAAESFVLEVRVGSQVQQTDDADYFPPVKSQIVNNKAFRFMVETDHPPEISVHICKKLKNGQRGRLLAVARVLLSETCDMGFHNLTLTLVSKRGLPNAHVRLSMVFWHPVSDANDTGLLPYIPPVLRSRSAHRIVLAGSLDEAEVAVAVPDS